MDCRKIQHPDKIKLARALVMVEEIDLRSCEFSAEEVIVFLTKCKSLKEFHFKHSDDSKRNQLNDCLNRKKLQVFTGRDNHVYVKL